MRPDSPETADAMPFDVERASCVTHAGSCCLTGGCCGSSEDCRPTLAPPESASPEPAPRESAHAGLTLPVSEPPSPS